MQIQFRILSLLIGVGVAALGTHVAAYLLGIDLPSRIHRLQLEYFPPEPMGLQVSNSTLGWTNRPNGIVRHTHEDYDVYYRIDEWEGRIVPGRFDGAPIIQILGGSFAFGQGVEDHETFAAILQSRSWSAYSVRLRASNGWGTAQAFVALSEDLDRGDKIQLALYGWLPFHNGRNHQRASWLEMVERSHQRLPHFTVRDGQPFFEGLIGLEAALPDETPGLAEDEWRITEALVRAMDQGARNHGTRFVLLIVPFENAAKNPDVIRMVAFLEREGIEFIQPTISAEEYLNGLRLPTDGHPNAKWHALVAAELSSSLSPRNGDD